MVTEGDLTLGGEHAMQYTYDVLFNRTLETCNFFTNVTPINLTKNKKIRGWLHSVVVSTSALHAKGPGFAHQMEPGTILRVR